MPDIKELEPEERECKFIYEKVTELNQPYSISACFNYLRIMTELRICNCTIHTSPPMCKIVIRLYYITLIETIFFINFILDSEYYCSYEGLICIRQSKL